MKFTIKEMRLILKIKEMKKIIVILSLSILFFSQTKAQKLSYPLVNQLTYSQYLNKDWRNLIQTGKKSLKQGIDFYYLRNRMGIAYFELKKYGLAVIQFQKSLEMNPDDYIKKSLYYSYLYAGRLTDAFSMTQKFSPEIKEELKLKYKLQSINIDLFIESMQYNALQISDINGTENLKGTQEITKSRFSPKISLSFAQKNGRNIFSYQFLHNANIYRLQDGTDSVQNFETSTNQHRFYYLKSFRLNNSFNFNYALNLLPGVGQSVSLQTLSGKGRFQQESYITTNYSFLDWQVTGGIAYKSVFYKISMGAAYGQFSSRSYSQIEILPTIYPLANLNLYFSPKYIIQFGKPAIYGLSAGSKIFSKMWLQLDYLKANNTAFSTNLGSIVYNSAEKINDLTTLSLIFPFKKMEITLSYVREKKLAPYSYDSNSSKYIIKYLTESANLLYISLKF